MHAMLSQLQVYRSHRCSPLCGCPKIRHRGAQTVRSIGFVSFIFAASRLERTFALQKHGSHAAETLQKLLRSNFVRRTGAATSRLSEHLRSSKRFNRVVLTRRPSQHLLRSGKGFNWVATRKNGGEGSVLWP